MRPIYHFHIGDSVGLVCIGDEATPGRYANGQHPETGLPKANARYNMDKISIVSGTSLPGIKYVPDMRIKFPITAIEDIDSGMEVIVNYKSTGFWVNNEKWDATDHEEIITSDFDRDIRIITRRLYTAPSEHIALNPVTQIFDVDLSEGLFSDEKIPKGTNIVKFIGGEVINIRVLEQRKAAGKFGYFIKINKYEFLDCYQSRMEHECKASCVNSANSKFPIQNKTTKKPAYNNCKFKKYYCNEKEEYVFYFKAKEDIEPHEELLGDYEPHIKGVD